MVAGFQLQQFAHAFIVVAGAIIIYQGMTFYMVTLYLLVTLCTRALLTRRRICYSNNGVHKDFISQLPDDVLVSIIARTPTKFAVTTSILSKRWRNLYKYVSRYKLRCADMPRHTCPYYYSEIGAIIDTLKRFLSLCTGSEFHFYMLGCCLTKSYANQFEQCIYSLGKSGIKELTLHLSCGPRPTYVPLSCHIISELPSLQSLSLFLCSLQPNLKSICYSLQTLSLSLVTLGSRSLECILSNCVSLHYLSICHCDYPTKLCFRGPSLRLKTLIIKLCGGATEIELYASNLTTFECAHHEMVNIKFDHVPQLKNLYLSLKTSTDVSLETRNILPFVFGELPKDMPHLSSLAFDTKGGFYQENTRLVWMGMKNFGHLKQLALDICCTGRTNLLMLTPYLESCPLLEEFHRAAHNVYDDDVVVLRNLVIQVHTKLKKVGLSTFRGMDTEIELALYILRSAVALEQMFISRRAKRYSGSEGWITKTTISPWTEETRKKIEQRLQCQPLSKTAKLKIQP